MCTKPLKAAHFTGNTLKFELTTYKSSIASLADAVIVDSVDHGQRPLERVVLFLFFLFVWFYLLFLSEVEWSEKICKGDKKELSVQRPGWGGVFDPCDRESLARS